MMGHKVQRVKVYKVFVILTSLIVTGLSTPLKADEPTIVDPNLEVKTVISGLVTPIAMAFLDTSDILVLEKNTGKVQRVMNGALHSTVLDLAVNFGSERGLLGIVLHPDFPGTPFVYLYWTESNSGSDTPVLSQTFLLGNRVDRFVWDGSLLSFDRNVIQIRAIQQDTGQPERGNHNGGTLRFGPDGKLYIFIGDVGRRGQLQNLLCGPTEICPGQDDQFGGPQPDNAHLTGVILRLNDDGSSPDDNPFFSAGAAMGGEVGNNIQKIFSYGHRNAIGMAFDPRSGNLWLAENGDDTFSELNRVMPGMNGGWVQVMGPLSRICQYKEIETSPDSDPFTNSPYFGLQQVRWSPENIADTQAEALSRLFMLPGAHYGNPAFSWKFEVSPAGIGFVNGRSLGPQFDGDLIVGAATFLLDGGHLFHFNLTGNRNKIAVDDPRLEDRVADNLHKWDITESESLLFGNNFGISTDIQTGPNGNLFVVSLSNGAIYEIFRKVNHAAKDKKPALFKGNSKSNYSAAPANFTLLQNYPNPFNPTTVIEFQIADAGFVSLIVYDFLGREVKTLVNREMEAGIYDAKFDASDLPSGIYIYKLIARNYISTKKMLLMK